MELIVLDLIYFHEKIMSLCKNPCDDQRSIFDSFC